MNLLYVLFFLDMLNLAVFIPVFSPFLKAIGGTPFALGIMNSICALVSLVWNPVVGSMSDQIGRKGLLIKCLLASAIGSILIASSNSLTLVFLGRLIGSLGSGAGILLRSIVADTYKTPEEKKTFFRKCAPVMSIAFLFGSVSSGFLSEVRNGFSLAFFVMAIIMGVAALIAAQQISNDSKSKTTETKRQISLTSKALNELKLAVTSLQTISWPRYKNLFYVKGFYDLSTSIIFANVGLIIMEEFDLKGREIGYVFMMTSLCRVVANVSLLRLKNLLQDVSYKNKIIGASIVLLISYIAMAVSSTLLTFLPFLGVMCFARALMDTLLTELISMRTTPTDRGKVIGAFENLAAVNMFIAPLLSAFLSKGFGERAILSSAVIPIALCILAANNEKDSSDISVNPLGFRGKSATRTSSKNVLVKNKLPKDPNPSKGRRKPKSSHHSVRKIPKVLQDLWNVSWSRYKFLFIMKISYDFAIVTVTSNAGFILMDAFQVQRPYMGRVFMAVSSVALATNLFKLKPNNFLDQMSDHKVIINGGLVLIGSFIGMAISPRILLFVAFLVVMCVPRAILDVKLTEMLVSETLDEDRGKVIGVFENIITVVGFIVPAMSGLLAQAIPIKFLALASILPTTIAIVTAKIASKSKLP